MTVPRGLGWYWHRLRAMDCAEITERVNERARRWREHSASDILEGFHLEGAVATYPELPDRVAAPEWVSQAVSREAASIREGRWLLFGWNQVQVPSPPIWHHDYFHSADAPTGIAARYLNHRRLPGVVDARCIWETNRWSELVWLAQNAWLNGVLDDARLAQRWLLDWSDKNRLGIGINWCSALEVGLRLVNFCWFDALIRACGGNALTRVQNQLAKQIVPGHAWWVWRYRSFGSSANNHLLGELAGLVLAARRWPSLGRVACSADQAWELMSAQILSQFAEDGGNREQALHYHQFAWEMAWQAKRAMPETHCDVAERLRQAARFLSDLVHEVEPWDFGDSDDAQITPFASRRPTAVSEWKAWLLGQEQGAAVRFWLGEPPSDVRPLSPGEWRRYPRTGLAVQEVNGWKARVDGSPLGFGSMAAHGHSDAMHVSLWDGDRALVVDPGTGGYFASPELRTKFASWEAHNGPLPVSGRARPYRAGLFLWTHHHLAPQLSVDGEACSVRFASDGLPITRIVRYLIEADAWRVTDEIEGDSPYTVRWRLAPQWKVVPGAGPGVTLVHAAGGSMKLVLVSDSLIGCDLGEDLVSPRFGALDRGVVITVTFKKRLVSQWHRVVATGRP